MSNIKNDQILLYCHFYKIVKGPGTIFKLNASPCTFLLFFSSVIFILKLRVMNIMQKLYNKIHLNDVLALIFFFYLLCNLVLLLDCCY